MNATISQLGFVHLGAGHRELAPASFPAGINNPATIGRRHAFSETVFVSFLSVRRLKCTLCHDLCIK
jgi:hypothetical protein